MGLGKLNQNIFGFGIHYLLQANTTKGRANINCWKCLWNIQAFKCFNLEGQVRPGSIALVPCYTKCWSNGKTKVLLWSGELQHKAKYITSLDHGNKFTMRNHSLWYIPNQDQFLEDLGVRVLGCAVLLDVFIGFTNWNQLILFPVYWFFKS